MEERILRLNIAGQPIEWLHWQDAVCLYARDLVAWSLGGPVRKVIGGYARCSGVRSQITLPAIIACGGRRIARYRQIPPLTNRALFARDNYLCLYCGNSFVSNLLSRDHVHPVSRGGRDVWQNVVSACKRCNQRKSNHLLQDIDMELLALPFCPNNAEYLALINSDRIRGDQMEFLRPQFSENRIWH
ncbi:HNH endonuclease [Gilvimarinus sp. DA14]|uniref:HNH endonuclease n=1 Tax=Gilvimarinus sp. DA14 TaxID=2956798 RepID=UPI0020B75268|nr:HNH endonuclease [Gilvimarinus sp. DA14]UTF59358.1 HNH endonuclease [Gilvimarinus sp. DA14]